MNIEVVHQPEQRRFSSDVEGHPALIEYRIEHGVMTLTHTKVAPDIEGRGIGGELVRAALDHAREQGLTVRPTCSFARAWMDRHPQTAALRA